MICSLTSANGCCPSCNSDNWKSAKVIIASGKSEVNTESEGGGWGGAAGMGKGRGGIDINYQGIDLNTNGHISSAEAIALSALIPELPNWCQNYNLHTLLSKCKNASSLASDAIIKIDQFALDRNSVDPRFTGSITHDEFEHISKTYNDSAIMLQHIEEYEIDCIKWNNLRVCSRCGEYFVTESVMQQANKKRYDIPPFTFEGYERKCPNSMCQSYIWKSANAYFDIKIKESKRAYNLAKTRVEEATDFANNPTNDGFFKNLWKKLTIPTPERAHEELNLSLTQLNKLIEKRDNLTIQYKNADNLRVCIKCENIYQLS